MSKIADILGPEEDEQDLPDFYSQSQESRSSDNTTTLAYRQQRSIAVTSASNSPDSASGSASASRSRTGSHSGYYSSRPSSHNQNRPVVAHSTEEPPAEDYTGHEAASSHTMDPRDPRTVFGPNQAHHYSYPSGQNPNAAAHTGAHTGARGSRGPAGCRDGYYVMDHGAATGLDPTTTGPIMHPGSTIFNAHYGSTAYGSAAAMDTNMNGIMQQHHQQHHQAEYSGEYVGDMASYGDYQEETEVTPRTGRPSRAKKGKPVHNCLNCGRVFTRAEHLRRHQLSHEPFKYFCSHPGCNKSFSRPDLLSRHQQKHTDTTATAGSEPADRSGHHQLPDVEAKVDVDGYAAYQPSSFVPRTPQDTGITAGHHLSINLGHSDGDPAISYMHAQTINSSLSPPHSVAVDSAPAVSATSTGYPYRHSYTSPSMAWPPSDSDSTINSTLASSIYREYSVSADGGAYSHSHATLWPPGASAVAVNLPHRFVAASSASSSSGWIPQSLQLGSKSGNKTS